MLPVMFLCSLSLLLLGMSLPVSPLLQTAKDPRRKAEATGHFSFTSLKCNSMGSGWGKEMGLVQQQAFIQS